MESFIANSANSCPLTPLGFLERAAIAYGDSPSIVYNDKTFTWSQTNRRCLQLASTLSSIGIQRGHVVSVVAPNVPSMYELQFGVPMSGAILNNINTRLDAKTLSILLQHSESKLVFVDQLSSSLVLEAISLFPKAIKRPQLVLITDNNVEDEYSSSSSSSSTVDFINSYEGIVDDGDSTFKWVRPMNEWDPMVLNYTSGTTSNPKGVLHSHRGAFMITVNALIDWNVPSNPVYLWTLPMFHVNGWSYTWGIAAMGGTNVCLRKVDPQMVFELISKHGVTHMCGAPVVLNMLSNHENATPLKNPVKILTAGAPPPAPDRSKDVIISGGENISSTEVESVLYSNPTVNEVAVVAKPDKFWGETPCAFVSLKSSVNKPSEDAIIEFCRERMPHYMVPKTVVFQEELPKTSTGKIQKFMLREIAKTMP
ncbi:hypothetical protein ACFE04_018348 [Oxalis oulophora]